MTYLKSIFLLLVSFVSIHASAQNEAKAPVTPARLFHLWQGDIDVALLEQQMSKGLDGQPVTVTAIRWSHHPFNYGMYFKSYSTTKLASYVVTANVGTNHGVMFDLLLSEQVERFALLKYQESYVAIDWTFERGLRDSRLLMPTPIIAFSYASVGLKGKPALGTR